MKDLETTIRENEAYAKGKEWARAGEERDNPYVPAWARLRELWYRGYDEVKENG